MDEKAIEILEIPEEFSEAARPMYREYEIALAIKMGKEVHTEAQICQWILMEGLDNPMRLLFESYSRNVLEKCQMSDGEMGYRVTTFYRRYPHFTQYEPEEYAKYSQDMVDRLNEWDLKVYMESFGNTALALASGEDVPMHQSQYLTLEETYAMVEGWGEQMIIVPCNCKTMGRCEEFPVNICVCKLVDEPNTPYDRKLGTILTLEDTKKLITQLNKKGLMQCGEHEVICNCDGKYCYPVKMAKILKTRLRYPRSHYEILWDKERCIECGKCAKICNHNAFVKDETGHMLYDADKCWGCTICAPNCPKGAITLKKRTRE